MLYKTYEQKIPSIKEKIQYLYNKKNDDNNNNKTKELTMKR